MRLILSGPRAGEFALHLNDAEESINSLEAVRIINAHNELAAQQEQEGPRPDMPRDREDLQRLLNTAYRKGNQDAHAALRASLNAMMTANIAQKNLWPDGIAVSIKECALARPEMVGGHVFRETQYP